MQKFLRLHLKNKSELIIFTKKSDTEVSDINTIMVTQTGFEPMNNALRGHRVKPLLHWASDKLFNHNCFSISTGFYRFLHHSHDCYLLFSTRKSFLVCFLHIFICDMSINGCSFNRRMAQ